MKFSEKTCLITGTNSGLGLATARRFAALGMHIILVCRDAVKTEDSIRAIREAVPSASLDGLTADLCSIQSVNRLIEQVSRKYSSLDILFNNAAVMKMERTTTPDGFETMFQTNYLAPVLLANGLAGLLQKKTPSQIINIAVPPANLWVDFDDLQFARKFNSLGSFFQTKLYLLLSSLDLSRRLADSGVHVNCLDPGPFRSNISRDAPIFMRLIFKLGGASSEKASQYVQNLAEKAEMTGFTGKVFVKLTEQTLADYWQDFTIRERLWNETKLLIDGSLPKRDHE